jgi:hypothetical protein
MQENSKITLTSYHTKDELTNENNFHVVGNSVPTSSAVQAIASNPMYEKKTVADPESNPLIPLGKYLSKGQIKKLFLV